MKLTLLAATCAAALACAIPAFAATPAKDSAFEAKGNHNQVTPTFETDKTGTHVKFFSYFNACAPVPVLNMPAIAIKHGSFSYTGTVTDVTKKKLKVKITGRFVKATVVKGTVNFSQASGKSCPTASYTAKRTGKATGQQF